MMLLKVSWTKHVHIYDSCDCMIALQNGQFELLAKNGGYFVLCTSIGNYVAVDGSSQNDNKAFVAKLILYFCQILGLVVQKLITWWNHAHLN